MNIHRVLKVFGLQKQRTVLEESLLLLQACLRYHLRDHNVAFDEGEVRYFCAGLLVIGIPLGALSIGIVVGDP
jgi:hypothetical protein